MITFRFSLKRNFCNSKSKKPEVLRLYKRIIRTGKEWPIPVESEYILNEARTLFKKNKNLKDEKEINQVFFYSKKKKIVYLSVIFLKIFEKENL